MTTENTTTTTAYEIPLSPIDQRFQIPLGGITYQLTVKWCAPAATWVLDIADEGGAALVSGIPIVTGVDLLEQHQHLGIAGQMFAQTDGNTFAAPTQGNLGTAGHLYFIAQDGATSTVATAVASSAGGGYSTVGVVAPNPYIDVVRDFSTPTDGATPAASRIQAALDAAKTGMIKAVYIPHVASAFVLDATLSIPAGVVLFGENRKGGELSRLKPASGFTAPLIKTEGYGSGRILRPQVVGIFLDGAATTLTAMQLMMQEGIVRDCTIKNCWTYGIQLAGYGSGTTEQALNNLIENNYLSGDSGTTFYDAIFADYHASDTTYRGNYIEAASDACIKSRAFNDMLINNHLYNAPTLLKTETSCDKTIVGNFFENCTGSAIDIADGSTPDAVLNATITANTFRNVNKGGGVSGIVTVAGSNVNGIVVSGNTIRRDASTSFSTPYFVYFNGTAPLQARVGVNIWQSGVITTAESNIPSAAHIGISPSAPQGRLTLSSGVPVLTSSVSAATTVYYTPYLGVFCPIWDGLSFYMASIGGELSQTLTDATKSPSAVATNSIYDMFVWIDGATPRCTRGAAWSTSSNRGTGVGTAELNRVKGLLVNKYAITNGPAAGYGTYVGTVATNASSTVDFIFGGNSSGGTASVLNVWNCFNRVTASVNVGDTAPSTGYYSYTTGAWRQANGSSTMRISFLNGLNEDAVSVTYTSACGAGTPAAWLFIGIGIDSTSTPSGYIGSFYSGGSVGELTARYSSAAIGVHYAQALEYGCANGNFYPNYPAQRGGLSLIIQL